MNRVLVVEDHPTTRTLLRSILARKGWQVDTAGGLFEGLAALEHPPDCILLDIILPDGDGIDILEHVRSRGFPTRVVVMTSLDPSTLTRLQRLKPEAVLRKPVDVEDLAGICDGTAAPGQQACPIPDDKA